MSLSERGRPVSFRSWRSASDSIFRQPQRNPVRYCMYNWCEVMLDQLAGPAMGKGGWGGLRSAAIQSRLQEPVNHNTFLDFFVIELIIYDSEPYEEHWCAVTVLEQWLQSAPAARPSAQNSNQRQLHHLEGQNLMTLLLSQIYTGCCSIRGLQYQSKYRIKAINLFPLRTVI